MAWITRREFGVGAFALSLSGLEFAHAAAPALRVLVVDGINNHDWRTGTAAIREILFETGLFAVEVSTTPPRDAKAAEWDLWTPDFSRFDVVVNNFNGGHLADGVQWPRRVQLALEKYVSGGGGLVSFHAANNAFLPWVAYNEMIGLGWREASYGPGLRVTEDDKVVVVPQGAGLGPGHPPRMDFAVHVQESGSPITKGMPRVWMHPSEQLTHGQHGLAQAVPQLTVLTYALSPVSKQNEPMDWVRNYGKGRVYTTMLGHTWDGEANPNLECIGFRTLLVRGVEWAAAGRVTLPVPDNFPGPEKVSLRKTR